jgi:prolipoprotein diacylglyceryltransferase
MTGISMDNLIFLAAFSVFLVLLLGWGFAHLPHERWQMLAAIPWRKREDGRWQGINLTYYGLFLAGSQTLAVSLLLILLGAAGISVGGSLLAIAALLAFCLPAARIVAIMVEGKRHTFTVGGASFVGIVLAPWIILLADRLLQRFASDQTLPVLPTMAAMAVAYALGEGLGRLGCISFGCCYGKPLKDCHPMVQRLFAGRAFTFAGPTKKAVYAGGYAGEPLLPIQGITCIIYCLTTVIGSALFLRGHYIAALITAILVTQLWRVISETMRDDFRGFSFISAYQKMGGLAVLYTLAIVMLWPAAQLSPPSIADGIILFWHPGIILGLQLLWLVFFLYFGRSTVTRSALSFELLQDRL